MELFSDGSAPVSSVSQARQKVRGRVRELIQGLVDSSLAKFRKQVCGSIIQSIDDEVNNLVNALMAFFLNTAVNPEAVLVSSTPEILPEHTKLFYSTRTGNEAVLLEIPPHFRTLMFSRQNPVMEELPSYRGVTLNTKYYLSLPYVIFAAVFKENLPTLRIYFRNAALTSFSDRLCAASLPNVYNDVVCLGAYPYYAGSSFADRVNHMISYFWQSYFTFYYTGYAYESYPDTRIVTLSAWARATAADPEFISGVKWIERQELRTVWDELCTQVVAGTEQINLKNRVGVRVAAEKNALKQRIETFCQTLPIEGQFAKDVGGVLEEVLDLITVILEDTFTQNET